MIQLDRLKAQLMTSGLQQKDNALFQVISQLIDALRLFMQETGTISEPSDSGLSSLVNNSYLTDLNESASLPNSRQLLAGLGITFDDSVANKRTITSSSVGAEWSVLTNGDAMFPELIFVAGDVIMLHTP